MSAWPLVQAAQGWDLLAKLLPLPPPLLALTAALVVLDELHSPGDCRVDRNGYEDQ